MRILVLAFHFPPSGGGGVQRTLKHVKYLFREGIDASVIAAQDAFPLHDETLLDELPGSANVIRTEVLEFPEAQEAFAGVLRMAGLPPAPEARTLWPDVRAGWLVPAVSAGLRAIGAESPSVIYSTHPPATAHLIALVLHRITRIPWVADFRDGWTLDPMFSAYGRSLPGFTAARRSLEETITSEATFVTVADDSMDLGGLQADDGRRVTIGNGVDPEDFPAEPPSRLPPDPSRLRLSHVGTLHHARDGASLFQAIGNGVDTGRIDPDKIEVRLVGWATPAVNVPASADLPITATGYVNHSAAIAEMLSASALLFYEEAERKAVTGKIYEYLATGLPILCVASPDNLGARLVQELDAGVCVDVRDQVAIAEQIAEFQSVWADGRLRARPSVRERALERFSRRDRAIELAAVLGQAAVSSHVV
jgi:glycosyltransferase involved in cell wall biosynthesis